MLANQTKAPGSDGEEGLLHRRDPRLVKSQCIALHISNAPNKTDTANIELTIAPGPSNVFGIDPRAPLGALVGSYAVLDGA